MNEPRRPLWRAILFYRITNWDWLLSRDNSLRWRIPTAWCRRLLDVWQRRPREWKRKLAQASAGFDLRWARWLVTLSVLLPAVNFLPYDPAWEWAKAISSGAFSVLLCAYFAFLLFFRLQCSLLEFIVLTAFLGNVVALIWTTPYLSGLGPGAWSLAPLAGGWVLYGTVVTLVEARILGLEKPLPRLLLLAGNWYILASPAMFISGVLLRYTFSGRALRALVSPNMAAWGVPLLLAGLAGCVLGFWLSRKARRAAREILNY